MELFIDTNIYLTFYHYTNEDLEELKKLLISIRNGNINLILTDQVVSEFKRNREPKIYDALKKFEEQKLNNQFPQICKEYPEYSNLRDGIKMYEENKNIILKKLYDDIDKTNLGADKIINDLFTHEDITKTKSGHLEKAKLRISIGNPPGKNGSLGDAINWEILLSEVSRGKDLYLISDDKDYYSPINEYKLSKFLNDEWAEDKQSNIFYYRKLSDFFRDKFPDIKLTDEIEKETLISNLVNSSNFQNTHKAVAMLSKYTDFSKQQVDEIIDAGINNNQVYWINTDEDVIEFYLDLVKGREDCIDQDKLAKIYELFKKAVPEINEEDFPF